MSQGSLATRLRFGGIFNAESDSEIIFKTVNIILPKLWGKIRMSVFSTQRDTLDHYHERGFIENDISSGAVDSTAVALPLLRQRFTRQTILIRSSIV